MKKNLNSKFVVNTNTNIIYKYVENELYISKKDLREQTNKNGLRVARKSNQSTKWIYARVKNGEIIDFKKTFPISRVRKYLVDGYFIECKNYQQALYHQAKLRYDKSTDERNKQELKEVMERILEESPECLI